MVRMIQFHLIPTPGAKPEFLANVVLSSDEALPSKIVLEGYTRDAWAWKPDKSWISYSLKCADDRSQKKVGEFLAYLKQRQKCAYGFIAPSSLVSISYIQSSGKFTCRVARDLTQIPNCTLKPKMKQQPRPQQQPQQSHQQPQQPRPPQQQQKTPATKKKKSGMLGNLLGAQKRTDQHMDVTVQAKPKAAVQDDSQQQKTAQQVLQDFRATMEQKMLDFDISPENSIGVKLVLSELTKELSDEDKPRVTMELLKYIVYEQAEEVNDEWVAHKEPSEFMDEVVVRVYKEAPPEVLEEVQKADLPEEVRGQQRAMQQARQRTIEKQEAKLREERQNLAVQTEEDMATLNTNKRDRRTIEEIQRELNDSNKKLKS